MGLDFPYNQPSTRVTSRNAEQPKDLKKLGNDGNKEVKKGVLRSCLRPPILLKKGIWHRCFPVNFAKFQTTPLLQNTPDNCLCSLLLPIILSKIVVLV